jgi:hypothetical protein
MVVGGTGCSITEIVGGTWVFCCVPVPPPQPASEISPQPAKTRQIPRKRFLGEFGFTQRLLNRAFCQEFLT